MTSETPSQFHVFLCHNSKDKPEVKEIALELRSLGLKPWLDEWELRPGLSWQELLEEQIEYIHSAAVFIGSSGIGPWQNRELRAFLNEFVGRGCPVIPVLLATAPQQPQLPIFLRAMTWVDFRRADPDPMGRLIWGITGEKPKIVEVIPKLSAEEFLDRGLAKYNSGDYQGAIADFDRAIQLQPDYANAYYNRGRAKYKSEDKQGAIADNDRAIQLQPDLAGAYNTRGVAKYDSGDYPGALADYDRAIQLKPDYAEAYNNRGNAKSDS
ncbi:toll/interleukin-1 receptor domain-containing protein, partial [Pannus brasiliensis CCIBt3594]